MIRKKKRGRTPAYRIIALILIQLISFCGSRNASASGVKDLIGLLGGIVTDLSYGFLDPRIKMGER